MNIRKAITLANTFFEALFMVIYWLFPERHNLHYRRSRPAVRPLVIVVVVSGNCRKNYSIQLSRAGGLRKLDFRTDNTLFDIYGLHEKIV
jgi:hypothetical protein